MTTMYDDTIQFNLKNAFGNLYRLGPTKFRGEYLINFVGAHLVTGPAIPISVFTKRLTTFNLTTGKKNTFEIDTTSIEYFYRISPRNLFKDEAHNLASYELKQGIEPITSILEKKIY